MLSPAQETTPAQQDRLYTTIRALRIIAESGRLMHPCWWTIMDLEALLHGHVLITPGTADEQLTAAERLLARHRTSKE